MSVAKVLATVSGTALKPGVSLNRRYYSAEAIADAVRKAQPRLADGSMPLSMRSHHAADDDSTRIVGRVRSLTVAGDGSARFTADIADTEHGRTIASLLDTTGGTEPFLRGVSIRGLWEGRIRKIKGPDGADAEQGDSLSLTGLDYTASPGVPGAAVDAFAWAKDGASETTERVLITESVQEARVTITEETAPAPVLTEADQAALPFTAPHVLENGLCVTCAAVTEGGNAPGNGKLPYGDIQYADPGYQSDKQKRYPIDNRAHVKAALAYLAKKANAAKYTPAQLKRVMGRIRAAAKKFGIQVAAESAGWSFDAPAQVTEALAEHLGMASCAGSWSVRASNGPVDICLSSYSMDPEDLDVILRAAADAACKALATLDPDMDGDIDLPGVSSDTDPDGDAPGESAPDEASPTDPAAGPAAATTETEAPMAETTTPAAESAPGIDQAALAKAVTEALEAQDAARKARKAQKRAAQEKAAADAAKIAAESAALGTGTPATAGASVSETEDQRRGRLAAIVEQQFAAAAAKEGLATAKTDEQLVAEMLEERMVPLRQARAETGGVQRKGIAALEAIADAPGNAKVLASAANDELAALAGAAFGPRGHR